MQRSGIENIPVSSDHPIPWPDRDREHLGGWYPVGVVFSFRWFSICRAKMAPNKMSPRTGMNELKELTSETEMSNEVS